MRQVSLLNSQVLKLDVFPDIITLTLVLKVRFKGVIFELLFAVTVKISFNAFLSICEFLLGFFTLKADQNHSFVNLETLIFSFFELGIARKNVYKG